MYEDKSCHTPWKSKHLRKSTFPANNFWAMSHVTHISEKKRKKESESCHRYEWANIWYISHQIPLGNASRYVFISMYETALYFHKRALNSRKRALHFHTRAIHCPSNTSGQWVTLHLHFYVWKRWKSSIFPQKSPRFPQKSPSFPQKSHTFPQESPTPHVKS